VCLLAAHLHARLSSSDGAQQALSGELDATKSRLTSVVDELDVVQRSRRQHADLLSRAAASLTSLANEMNQLAAAADNTATD